MKPINWDHKSKQESYILCLAMEFFLRYFYYTIQTGDKKLFGISLNEWSREYFYGI